MFWIIPKWFRDAEPEDYQAYKAMRKMPRKKKSSKFTKKRFKRKPTRMSNKYRIVNTKSGKYKVYSYNKWVKC